MQKSKGKRHNFEHILAKTMRNNHKTMKKEEKNE